MRRGPATHCRRPRRPPRLPVPAEAVCAPPAPATAASKAAEAAPPPLLAAAGDEGSLSGVIAPRPADAFALGTVTPPRGAIVGPPPSCLVGRQGVEMPWASCWAGGVLNVSQSFDVFLPGASSLTGFDPAPDEPPVERASYVMSMSGSGLSKLRVIPRGLGPGRA